MGTEGRTDTTDSTVEMDDRGRITIPKTVRERLGVRPGDELRLDIESGTVRLHIERDSLATATSSKTEWGTEAFPDAGEAMFGFSEKRSSEGR